MASNSLLDRLRYQTLVDCDTLDPSIAERLGPFQDCTSNQAIAFAELQKGSHHQLLENASKTAKSASPKYAGVTLETLATEISMVALALRMVPHIKSYVHIQTNPFDAYSVPRTIAGATRILAHFKEFAPDFDTSRVCIKIPSTWEGLQACRKLESIGISTLATTLFTLEQAAVAAEAKCHYIAPYVHDLRAQIDPGFCDPSPILQLCVDAQRYFEQRTFSTQVLPASLKSIEECMMLSGAHHITIAPPLLEDLSRSSEDVTTQMPSLFQADDSLTTQNAHISGLIDNEEAFRMALTRRDDGYGEIKMIHAINIFCKMQIGFEALLKPYLDD